MSNRASIRRIAKIESERRAGGHNVLNLCGAEYRLGTLQDPTEGLPRCYASALNNCTGPMSKEHYVSENILSQLDALQTSDMPWLSAAQGAIAPKDALAGKCLCKYHNEFLSPLDHLAGKAFSNFLDFLNPNAPEVYVWGPSFSRWMLKVLVGIVGAKHVRIDGERLDASALPSEWMEILFGLRDFPSGYGLYMTPVIGAKISIDKRVRVSTLLLDNKLQGLQVVLAGIDFILCMTDPARAFNRNHPAYPDILYKPKGMNLDQRENRIRIFWD